MGDTITGMNRFASMNPMFSPARMSPYGRQVRLRSGLGCGLSPEIEEDDRVEMGCDKCKRMRKKMRAIAEMSGRRVNLGQTCSVEPAPVGLNCQRTSTGDIICSNGQVYAKDCPNAPVVNYAGVAQDVGGAPVAPPSPDGSAGGGSFLDEIPAWGLAAGGIAVAGILYSIFK